MALTATADRHTREDILQRLQIPQDGKVFVSSFDRPNITYTIEPKVRPFEKLERIIRAHRQSSGIIYCLAKKTTEEITKKLQKKQIRAATYHAGLSHQERKKVYTQFQQDELQVVVATIAFGMGIDKPNVRYVVHWDLPRNIESFYQESGRAGRDGLPAEAIVLYDPRDIDVLEYFSQQNQQYSAVHLSDSERKEYYSRQAHKQESLIKLCSNLICRRKQLLNYFEEPHQGDCGTCDVCLTGHEEEDMTIEVQKILSTILKTHQRFGMQYIIDVLLGKEEHQLRQRGHHNLSVFGVGADKTRAEWEWIMMQMIGKKLLRVDRDNYRILRCQKDSVAILKSETKIQLVPYRTALKHMTDLPLNLSEKGLFEALRSERAAIARQEGIPAYIVAQDSVLIDLIRQKPGTLNDLLQVSGFGYVKQQKYGPRFLKILALFEDK
jgi:ATP-dependent DNA helicase RecQ